jgi:hypothetical protein
VLVAERSPTAPHGSIAWVAGLVECTDANIVLSALFASVRPVATRVTIIGQSTMVVERSPDDDHLQGIALQAHGSRLALLVWARTGQLAALLSRLERRVESCVWPPGSARLEWIVAGYGSPASHALPGWVKAPGGRAGLVTFSAPVQEASPPPPPALRKLGGASPVCGTPRSGLLRGGE